ncbi:MAG: FAD-dependent monooxygenase [Xanthomonadales bacterium]|jgi:2-octaprenyl-6-methoxyphenol hydroxylase|nr:FAD-dependent monooxygenase [Xanthomonadales bacterium]
MNTLSRSTGPLIVGGGLVGNSLALALAGHGQSCTLIETQAPSSLPPSFDERFLALSLRSLQLLEDLGVPLARHAESAPIREILVTCAGEPSRLRLVAERHGLESFGRVLPARALGAALETAVAAAPGIRRLRPACFEATHPASGHRLVRVRVEGEVQQYETPLLVGADGSASAVRDALGLAVDIEPDDQVAILCNLRLDRPHGGQAQERFLADGPFALLPLPEQRMGMVWTLPKRKARALLAAGDREFLAAAQQAYGWRLGRFIEAGQRSRYVLSRQLAPTVWTERAVLVGNAAQTLHPIGAQGFNLGLRDAVTLARRLQGAADPGVTGLLTQYAEARSADRQTTAAFSERLLAVGRAASPLARLLRPAALAALSLLPPLETQVVRQGLGFGAVR